MIRPASSVPRCDHASVGVLISGTAGLLVFERATAPAGLAPVAGHVDSHGSPEKAAAAEVAEEVGLTVTRLHPLQQSWRANRCRRLTDGAVGHHWTIFEAQTSGHIRPSAREVRTPRWVHPDQLQQYARRTAAYAAGEISDTDFSALPGLEPVWVRFLHDLQLITMPSQTLHQIEAVL
ncbi:NUDIX domain-containing protein (plasmid) [Streptomyces sp. NBC_00536]|uniref:NUDIX domain-containing protein n=1 Tax=Streptomyces sp. NBC_00536 TaxID=2975769 RepID=UPI002E812942|nr:NUDIX domain-containing protein [Streptomyces sp. NBC_00536]WUC84311.1 NUDIX domain-containing protein [Streptomyces sp. NBC_00536]